MKILHLDKNHPLLIEQLSKAGFENDENYVWEKEAIEKIIHNYDGIVIRSRFPIDKKFIDIATQLKFIARVGAGLENIDTLYASEKGIKVFSSPEGNRNAVGEHTLGLLLTLFNKINKADLEIRSGQWNRESNRGIEVDGKTVGIIGYGNMGKAFAKKLRGFNCNVLCYDILENVGNEDARQVSLETLKEEADIVSLHTPWTPLTHKMVNEDFILSFKKSFWLLNTARGKNVETNDLVKALKRKLILGAGLDVLEFEKSSFEGFNKNEISKDFQALIQMSNVVMTPHVAGWTIESKEKLAQVIVDKILAEYG